MIFSRQIKNIILVNGQHSSTSTPTTTPTTIDYCSYFYFYVNCRTLILFLNLTPKEFSIMASSAILHLSSSSSYFALSCKTSRRPAFSHNYFLKPLIIKASTSLDYSTASVTDNKSATTLKVSMFFNIDSNRLGFRIKN